MSSGSRSDMLRQFRTLFESGTVAALTDGQLLERFLDRREDGGEVAFEALVARHGPMVLGVCRRALGDPNDVADAFQATFLVLVRKARSIRVDDSLGRWLYGVSRRVAGRARAVASRRPRAESSELDAIAAVVPDPDRFELAAMLDEELARLPEAYRSAVVLCDLGGLTHEEAARDLICPVGTIKSRLSRGRRRLRERLERRGLDPSAMAIVPTVPPTLAEAAVRASMAMVSAVSGKSAVGVVSASAVTLAEGVLKSMTGIKLKLAAAAALSIGVIATGAGVLAQGQREDAKPPGAGPTTPRDSSEGRPDDGPILATPATTRGGELAKLRGELDLSRKKLAVLRAFERSQQDPAIEQARARVARLESAIAEIDKVLTTVHDDQPKPARAEKPANPRRKPWPNRLPWDDPPRELSKVAMPDYVVEPPDIILVEVLEALPGRPITGEKLVRPDGKISLGFYGEIYVAGLTTAEIKAKVALHLRQFLLDDNLGLTQINGKTGKVEPVDPARSSKVFVDVAAYNSQVYYVQGEVATPGRLPITGNETVLDAILFSGGPTSRAAKDRIRLVRPAPEGDQKVSTRLVDLVAIVDRGDVTTNYQLLPGDRVIVEPDHKIALEEAASSKREPAAPEAVEDRLQTVERKLDDVLKALERLSKP